MGFRKYSSYQEAEKELGKKGEINYSGREGKMMEWGIYGYKLFDGRKYILKIGMEGKINGRVEILYELSNTPDF